MLLLAVVQVPPLVANVQPPVILVMVSLGVSLEGSHALMGNIVALFSGCSHLCPAYTEAGYAVSGCGALTPSG